jgi:hypothetical protein
VEPVAGDGNTRGEELSFERWLAQACHLPTPIELYRYERNLQVRYRRRLDDWTTPYYVQLAPRAAFDPGIGYLEWSASSQIE